MARPKEFEERDALTRALEVFWRKGYANTSMQDLTDAMQISRQSLYDTFGDKHTLFLSTMQHYIETAGKNWVMPLFQNDDVRTAIRRTFENIINESMIEPRGVGCFTVNAAVELASDDPEVSDCLVQAISATENCFYDAIIAAQGRGELAPEINAKAMASYLLNAVRGLRVMARLKPERRAMQDIVDVTLSVLG